MKLGIDVDDCGLIGLTTLAPDAERAVRTRQRCRAILERRATTAGSSTRTPEPRPVASAVGETAARQAMVGACCILCVVYVLALVLTTAGLQGMSR